MTQFLVTEENPKGYKLEEILSVVRNDILIRATKIMSDNRDEARHVLANNMRVLQLLTDSIEIAEDSSRVLERSFGKHVDGSPRIGEA
jgi:hypothetical protein